MKKGAFSLVSRKACAHERILLGDKGSEVDAFKRQAGPLLKKCLLMTVESWEVSSALALSNFGHALIPDFLFKDAHQLKRSELFEFHYPYKLLAFWKDDTYLSKPIEKFLSLFVEAGI